MNFDDQNISDMLGFDMMSSSNECSTQDQETKHKPDVELQMIYEEARADFDQLGTGNVIHSILSSDEEDENI